MAILHNRISQRELKQKLFEETEPRITISFYKYFFIEDPQLFRDELYKSLNLLKVFGRIYIASEGINAQISVPQQNFELFKQFLESTKHFKNIRLNMAVSDGKSFWVLKIKVREKIVADGISDPNFSMEKKGRYVDAVEFNKLSDDADTVIIDMRNHYEYEVGHFENAIEIPSDTFRDQLPVAVEMMQGNKERNIIMYCTGGIRCEKASSYMLHRGFKNVFHLEGGIINYTNKIKELNIPNKFKGKNFVFDDRLGERITEEIIAKCHQCDVAADTHINCANEACHLLFIQCEGCKTKYLGCCSESCKETISLPPEIQKELRKGKMNDSKI
ncbi:MAG: rhodanese-related sulfurtransferase, partial [Ferruginibacter sp.]